VDRAAQEPVADPWEGFAAAHTWTYADPRVDGLMLLPCVGGHADGRWLEPGIAVIGLSRHQARALGRAYGELAVYELEETTRLVLACDSDHLLVQAVVCHRGQQPPRSGAGHLDGLKVPRPDHRQAHEVLSKEQAGGGQPDPLGQLREGPPFPTGGE
jgi:hypothetical protein